MFFPENYKKPVLQSIVEASENGWNATCDDGTGPGTGGRLCQPGTGAGATKGGFDGHLYTNPDNSSRLFDSHDAGR